MLSLTASLSAFSCHRPVSVPIVLKDSMTQSIIRLSHVSHGKADGGNSQVLFETSAVKEYATYVFPPPTACKLVEYLCYVAS